MNSFAEPKLYTQLRAAGRRVGIWSTMQRVRAALRQDISRWVARGCPSPAPELVKKSVVRSYVTSFRTPVFIETGTYLANMIAFIADTGVHCHSIEIDPAFHARAKKMLARRTNVDLILGDSAIELPKLIENVKTPATFWLDGHYSGHGTGRSDVDTPISVELDAILNHPIKQHIILIDDARCFDGTCDYPKLHDLLARFDGHPEYQAAVSTDIIRIVPRGSVG